MMRFDVRVSCNGMGFHVVVEADNNAEAIQAAKDQLGPLYSNWKYAIYQDSCPDC